jgi:hypothetical protein
MALQADPYGQTNRQHGEGQQLNKRYRYQNNNNGNNLLLEEDPDFNPTPTQKTWRTGSDRNYHMYPTQVYSEVRTTSAIGNNNTYVANDDGQVEMNTASSSLTLSNQIISINPQEHMQVTCSTTSFGNSEQMIYLVMTHLSVISQKVDMIQ